MTKPIYILILLAILALGVLGFLRVNQSMNTLAEDEVFMESVRIMDKQDKIRRLRRTSCNQATSDS